MLLGYVQEIKDFHGETIIKAISEIENTVLQ